MKKWVLGTVIGGTGVVATGVGAGIATGVILPKTLELKDGISNFVPDNGSANMNWADKKINYVALGDSETAGYNGFMHDETKDSGGTGVTMGSHLSQQTGRNMGGDYLSYADFLANDLKKADKLGSYHNYAQSGATIAEQQQLFLENTQIHPVLKKADLITITIGANDLLSFIKILDLPFNSDLFGMIKDSVQGKVSPAAAANAIREEIKPTGQESDTNTGATSTDVRALAISSIKKLIDMAQTKDYSHIIDIARDFKETIFDALYRNLMMFIHDLHAKEIAPNAHIIILGHAMPFEQWPDKVLNAKREDLNGQTIKTMFDRLLDSMNKAANFSLTGSSDYSEYLSVDDLNVKQAFADQAKATDAGSKMEGVFTDFIKRDQSLPKFYTANAMANAADIHPSTFGHQLIGNAIFEHIYPSLGKADVDATSLYTFSKRYVAGAENDFVTNAKEFMAFDEKPDLNHSTSELFKTTLNGGGMINGVLTLIGNPLKSVLDFQTGPYIFEAILPFLSDDALKPAEATVISGHLDAIIQEADAKLAADTKFQTLHDQIKPLIGSLKGLINIVGAGNALDKSILFAVLAQVMGTPSITDVLSKSTVATIKDDVDSLIEINPLALNASLPTTQADIDSAIGNIYDIIAGIASVLNVDISVADTPGGTDSFTGKPTPGVVGYNDKTSYIAYVNKQLIQASQFAAVKTKADGIIAAYKGANNNVISPEAESIINDYATIQTYNAYLSTSIMYQLLPPILNHPFIQALMNG